jgi:hypothetical protein
MVLSGYGKVPRKLSFLPLACLRGTEMAGSLPDYKSQLLTLIVVYLLLYPTSMLKLWNAIETEMSFKPMHPTPN